MPLDLKRGIVRILSADGETTSGTGFILSEKGIIVACSHVVQAEKLQVRGYPRPERVEIVFRANGQKAAARLLPQAWRAADAEDVAFLQLEGPLPEDVEPLPLGSSGGAAGHQFQSFGFPDQSPEEGLYGEGQLIEQTSILGMKVWQVKSSEITPGFSGGPVFDEQARRVVGMVTSIAAPDKFGRLSETAFVTPAETLFSIYPAIAASDVRPYMGLAPFSEKDAEFFFGRKKLMEGLEEALRARPRFLLVMGPSGSGKSSLVQAGLIPRLRKGSVPGSDRWGIIVARPADRPFESLERAGLRGAYADLAQAVRGWMERNPGQEKLLLILDQFEEFLVTCPSDLRQRLWVGLKALLDSDIELTVMVVMRDDFYSRFAADAPPEVLAWTQHGFFQVGSELGKEELQEIISEPARRVGLRLEEGLADVITNDVLDSSSEGGIKAGRSTVLPLLEFALTQLWERREQGVLTHQDYQAAGKVTGSLTAWADQVCHSLEREGLGPVARRAFTDLVNLGDGTHPDSRRQRRLAELVHDGKDEKEIEAVQKVVQRLADARLVTTSREKDEESVQIIHDSLIREWARLQRWLKKDRAFLSWQRELEKDAREWRETGEPSRRDEGRLLRGRRLEEAERWQSERGRDLGEAEREFLQVSLDLRQREREKEERARAEKDRTRKRIIQGVVVFSIFSLALAGLAYDKMLEANDRKEEALARSLASQSEQIRGVTGSLTESVLLAVESLRHKETLEGNIALRRSIDLLPRCMAKLQHNGSVGSAVFSPDGQKLATACDDKTARIWNAQTGQELQRLEHDDGVNAAAFSPDGEKLATACDDYTARIWDAQTGRELLRLDLDGPVYAAAFSPDGQKLVTACNAPTARIWDAQTGKELLRLEHDDSVIAAAFSPDGRKLATACIDNTARIWNAQTGKELQKLEHDYWVRAAVFSPDSRKLATASGDFTARIWDAMTGRELLRLDLDGSVYAAVFSPDGQKLATVSADNTARIWDAQTGKEQLRLEHDDGVNAAAFSPDGQKLATACIDNTARIWDAQTGKELQKLEHDYWVGAAVFSPDSRKLAMASGYYTARIWDVQTGKELLRLEHDDGVNAAAFSPDGQKLATACDDNTARIWDAQTGKELLRLEHDSRVRTAVFSPDGEKLATACDDNTTRIWDAQTGKELQRLEHDSRVRTAVFSPDGEKLATACDDNTTRIWDAQTGKELQRLEHDDGVNAAVFSPDGQKLATVSDDNTARIWDAQTGKELLRLEHDDGVNAAVFSPDGRKLATVSDDNTARIWDVQTGQKLQRLEHDWNVYVTTAFSPDCQKLATVSDDRTARIWDAQTGKELQRLEHDDGVNAAVFSPDGQKLATVSDDNTARIWTLDMRKVMEEGCRRVAENMTRKEWTRFLEDPDSDCLTCPAEGSFNQSSIWPWGRRECQPCGGNLG